MKRNAGKASSMGDTGKTWIALLLAWVAGYSDAFGFLALQQIFFSAVSGNTVAINANLAKRNWLEVAHHGCPIISFAVGLVIGAIIEKSTCRLKIRRRFSIALGLESALLLAFTVLGPSIDPNKLATKDSFEFYLLIALLSGAMGIQTMSLRRVGNQSVNTPFITGMLVQSTENFVNVFLNAYDRFRNRPPEFPPDSLRKAVFHGGLWLCFAIGAFCGGLGEIAWKFPALFLPIAALAFIILCDLLRPVYD